MVKNVGDGLTCELVTGAGDSSMGAVVAMIGIGLSFAVVADQEEISNWIWSEDPRAVLAKHRQRISWPGDRKSWKVYFSGVMFVIADVVHK